MNSDHDGPDLAVQPQHQLAELTGCRRPPGLAARGLGPTAGYEPAVPSHHGGGLHDQEHLSEAFPAEHLAQPTQDGSVRVIKDRLCHLALQHQKLMTQSENLRIATVAAGQQQTNTSQHKANHEQEPKHERHGPKHERRPHRRSAT